MYQKSHPFAALTRSISDTSPTCVKILYARALHEVISISKTRFDSLVAQLVEQRHSKSKRRGFDSNSTLIGIFLCPFFSLSRVNAQMGPLGKFSALQLILKNYLLTPSRQRDCRTRLMPKDTTVRRLDACIAIVRFTKNHWRHNILRGIRYATFLPAIKNNREVVVNVDEEIEQPSWRFVSHDEISKLTLISLVWQPAANFFSTSEKYHSWNVSRMKCLQMAIYGDVCPVSVVFPERKQHNITPSCFCLQIWVVSCFRHVSANGFHFFEL